MGCGFQIFPKIVNLRQMSWLRGQQQKKKPATLIVIHNSGFFSCCTVRLARIIEYFNKAAKLPDVVDSSVQFEWYKPTPSRPIAHEYFQTIPRPIKYTYPILFQQTDQFIDFRKIPFSSLQPFVIRYFSLTDQIKDIIAEIIKKYSVDFENTCVLFYRGNDKVTETALSGYEDYLVRARGILAKNPNVRFLVQSDESEFIDAMMVLPNTFVFKDEIRHMKKASSSVDIVMPSTNYEFSKKFLAIVFIMSQCKDVICGSGNISLWITLYRGSCLGVQQFLEGKWL